MTYTLTTVEGVVVAGLECIDNYVFKKKNTVYHIVGRRVIAGNTDIGEVDSLKADVD